jgi:hypothetical protein
VEPKAESHGCLAQVAMKALSSSLQETEKSEFSILPLKFFSFLIVNGA